MRRLIRVALVTAAAVCVAPMSRAQSAIRFTLPCGPHAAGFRTVDQYDHSRTLGEPFDDAGRPRTGERSRAIQTSIWYPAVPAAKAERMAYGEYLELGVQPGSFPAVDAAGRKTAAATLANAFGATDTARIHREMRAGMRARALPSRSAPWRVLLSDRGGRPEIFGVPRFIHWPHNRVSAIFVRGQTRNDIPDGTAE